MVSQVTLFICFNSVWLLGYSVTTIATQGGRITLVGINHAIFATQAAIHKPKIMTGNISFYRGITLLTNLHNITSIATPTPARTNTPASIIHATKAGKTTHVSGKPEITTSNTADATIALLTTLNNMIATVISIVLTIRPIKFALVNFTRSIAHQSACVIS
jgi:hypothetical protein